MERRSVHLGTGQLSTAQFSTQYNLSEPRFLLCIEACYSISSALLSLSPFLPVFIPPSLPPSSKVPSNLLSRCIMIYLSTYSATNQHNPCTRLRKIKAHSNPPAPSRRACHHPCRR